MKRLHAAMLLGAVALLGCVALALAIFSANSVVATISVGEMPVALLRVVRLLTGASVMALDAESGHLFVAEWGSVAILDARSGRVLHRVFVGASPRALAVDARRHRLFVAVDPGGAARLGNQVCMIDTRSGRLLRMTPVLGPTALAVDTRTNRVFVASYITHQHRAIVTLLDATTGRQVGSAVVEALPDAVAVAERAGRVFVANYGDSTVSVLDATTGSVLQTIGVHGMPVAIAIDTALGRVFIADDKPAHESALDSIRHTFSDLFQPQSPRARDAGNITVLDSAAPTRRHWLPTAAEV